MRIAIQNPTTMTLVEKIASIVPQVDVVGPRGTERPYLWDTFQDRIDEWNRMGMSVRWLETAFADIDYRPYDMLIESVETFNYAPDWAIHCMYLRVPTVLKACWGKDPTAYLPPEYLEKKKHNPIILEMASHVPYWQEAGFTDVNALPNPVGDWWFNKPWTGEKEQILFVLAGKDIWRPDLNLLGWDWWEKLEKIFPGQTLHHDGAVNYKTPAEMAQLFSESRVFVNLDTSWGDGERPLALVFTEALAAGLPVVSRNLPGLDYHKYTDGNGVCSNNFDLIVDFIRTCLSDQVFATAFSSQSRRIAQEYFSTEVLRPRYEEIFSRAK